MLFAVLCDATVPPATGDMCFAINERGKIFILSKPWMFSDMSQQLSSKTHCTLWEALVHSSMEIQIPMVSVAYRQVEHYLDYF